MSGNSKPDIRSCSKEDLEQFFLEHGEKKFRVSQLVERLWLKPAKSFDEMQLLPKEIRQSLAQSYTLNTAIAEQQQVSSDGTVKYGFRLHDGYLVEGVMIPSGDRSTVCISSQAGCALGCKFCATGQLGFTRNLSAGEIFDQVTTIEAAHGKVSNLVFMGMGEPLMNYTNVKTAIERITDPKGLGMSPQRITLSSVGIPKMIRKLADDQLKVHFALSLHAATDVKRNQIIPVNQRYPLDELKEALKYYYSHTKKRFTVEYILFGNFNDSIQDATDLALFCRNFPVKINLIEYNPVQGTGFTSSAPGKTEAFVRFLEKRNLVINVRQSRGKDIAAACGQLAGKQLNG